MYNAVTLIGFLGQDPTSRLLPSGQPVVTFTVATSRRYKDAEGNKQTKTEWHNIVCFSGLAEIASKYLCKGKKVLVTGRIQTRTYDHKDHPEIKMSRTEIVADDFQMLDAKPKSDPDEGFPDPSGEQLPGE